ncbi:hypothetical protein SLEP1_g796 [Rubroshorea leprosula]|uniref:Uncharacterized protein n=1 Tax=Rubroshorea leprosula TaxID=152421 RepID=A0AAV5HKG2_9ROSI|nr:hypothetical protein SLEP1_g796 [Rubroshorea leprosula]
MVAVSSDTSGANQANGAWVRSLRSLAPACLTAFVTIFMLISIVVYDRFFVPAIRKYTGNPRGITLLQIMGVCLVLHVIIILIACMAGRKRLSVAKEHHIFGKTDTVPLTVFILLPQFCPDGGRR